MSDAPRISQKDLRELVKDGTELAKGALVVDSGGLAHLARFENKLFAEAAGSGAAPYKVQVSFDDAGVAKGRCACMAARSRPFCKHAAGLLVAWSRTPDAFAVADVAPAGAAPGETKKRAVRRGKSDDASLMRGGVDQVATLVRELAVAGVAALAADRAEQVRALGASLREQKLRRLAARTQELADMLARASARDESFDASQYAEMMADLLLTARKLEKHLGGEPLEERHVEELVGRTWTKKDRKPVAGLALVEYAFLWHTTADGFVVRESRFLELTSGAHYSEKQIVPAFLKRIDPKRSRAGQTLAGAGGGQYPGYAPLRLDLEEPGAAHPTTAADLAAIARVALPSTTAALSALAEHRKDVFAPDLLPVAVAVDALIAEGARMQLVDVHDAAVFLPDDRALEERLAGALRDAALRVLFGDLHLDGALPTLIPHAVLVEAAGVLELRALGPATADVVSRSKKVRPRAAEVPVAVSSWYEIAREAGLSSAAVAVGEVRAELADALSSGLASLSVRRVEPLVARLRDVSLAKQADLLAALPARPDPADRLDDFIKLHQVLGIALSRLAGAVRVDRSTLVPVPTYESVRVHPAADAPEPREVARRVARGELNRFQAAVLYAAHYEKLSSDELAAAVYPTWADGSAAPFIVRALRGRGESAVAAASHALGLGHYRKSDARRPVARTAALTAVRVLEANAAHPASTRLLADVVERHVSPTVRACARRALHAIEARRTGDASSSADAQAARDAAALRDQLLSAADKDARTEAADQIANLAVFECIPYLRASFAGDVTAEVRHASAMALARIGDAEMVDVFVRTLERRDADPQGARTACYALGELGDVRGIDALLDAWASGWRPAIVAEALKSVGAAALEPLLARVEDQPELVRRGAARSALAELQLPEVIAAIARRLELHAGTPAFVERAVTLLSLAGFTAEAERATATRITELAVGVGEAKTATREEKDLRKRVVKALTKEA